MKRLWVPFALLLLAACSQVTPSPSIELAPMTFGTSAYDYGAKLAKHSGGVYAVGATDGNLHATQIGQGDAFIRKYDTDGGVTWGKQFGTPQGDSAAGVASDSSNNAYVVGTTYGSLAGSRGSSDFFLRKYTSSGGVSWTRQFGTSSSDIAGDVAVLGSNIYVAGYTSSNSDYNAYLAKFNSSGTQLWTRAFGTSTNDYASDVAVDSSGNAYVVGYTYGALTGSNGGGSDMFVRKYNTSGSVVWTKQLHYSNRDEAVAVAVNGTSVFVAGLYYYNTAASIDLDVRLIKLTTSGSLSFSKRNGSGYDQIALDVSVVNGAVFASGYEYDSGNDSGGFVTKYSGTGDVVWSVSQDSATYDFSYGVLARSSSEVYVTGQTYGILGSANNGGGDAFLRRLSGTSGGTVWTDK